MAWYECLYGGGESKHETAEYTTNVRLSSSYVYLATGYFLRCTLKRPDVSSATSFQLFTKDENDDYVALTSSTSTSANTSKTVYFNTFRYGDIYIKKTGGTDVTTTAFNMLYELK